MNIIQLGEKNELGINLKGRGGVRRRFFYFVFISIFKRIPHFIGRKIIIEKSQEVKMTYHYRTRTPALELIYNYKHKPILSFSFLSNLVYNIMCNLDNCWAVRNRLKIVEYYIQFIIRNNSRNIVRIMSIAMGSARSVIEVIKNFHDGNKDLEIIFLDKDPEAIIYSNRLIEKDKLQQKYKIFSIQDDVKNINNHISANTQDIVEMVGLMDYFDFNKSVEVVSDIYKILRRGGYLVIANIRDNREAPFITNFFHWNMNYREPDELLNILVASGFKNEYITLVSEPFKIHTIAIAIKT